MYPLSWLDVVRLTEWLAGTFSLETVPSTLFCHTFAAALFGFGPNFPLLINYSGCKYVITYYCSEGKQNSRTDKKLQSTMHFSFFFLTFYCGEKGRKHAVNLLLYIKPIGIIQCGSSVLAIIHIPTECFYTLSLLHFFVCSYFFILFQGDFNWI